jgi:galactonate dehydratase
MKRREFFGGMAGAVMAGRATAGTNPCECAMLPAQNALGGDAFHGVGTRLRITNVKVFGVSLTPQSDRPYVFVKIETNEGLVGGGEGTLEGKAGAVMACINDFREFLIGSDPMQVEHHWQ